ncbi:MAG: hypothetical protein HKP61_17805 [Dactylosporangium sp.]|nr:hypothetical protein [Dactylosporangium sp.]
MDDARAASATFRQNAGEGIGQLHGIGQSLSAAEQGFRGKLGNTSHPRVVEAEARCREARQKIADAVHALNAAREAADQLSAELH